MKIYPFMKDERYIAIVKEYAKALNRTHEQVKNEVVAERVKSDSREAQRKIGEQLEKFYNQKKQEYDSEKAKIERVYKNQKKTYENPNEEMLKRQDFDTMVSLASEQQLEEMLNDEDQNFTEYEFNRMQLEFRNRGMSEVKFTVIRSQKNIGKEYLSDPNYQKLESEEQWLYLIRLNGNGTLLSFPDGDQTTSYSIAEIERATSKHFNPIEKLTTIEKGIKAMEENIQSYRAWTASLTPTLEKEVDEYVTDSFKQGKEIKLREYKDVDARAIAGTKDYDLQHEFRYLKERYHEADNYMYSLANPDYDIRKHLDYMRNKHQQAMDKNNELKKAIETAQTEGTTSEGEGLAE